jgi:hypothetical protein
MALDSFTSGVNTTFSSELNNNFNASGKIQQVYTSTGFDVSRTQAGTTTGSLELSDISASSLGNADYIIIEITAKHDVYISGATASNTNLQIQTKDLGGAYADTMTDRNIVKIAAVSGSTNRNHIAVETLRWIHTLTANEKANGVKVKILSKVVCTGADAQYDAASITNYQTTIYTGV